MAEPKRPLIGLAAVEAELARIERTANTLARYQGRQRRARPGRFLRVEYDELHALLLDAEADLNQAATTLRDTLEQGTGQGEVAKAAWEFKRHMHFMKLSLDRSMQDIGSALDRVALPGY